MFQTGTTKRQAKPPAKYRTVNDVYVNVAQKRKDGKVAKKSKQQAPVKEAPVKVKKPLPAGKRRRDEEEPPEEAAPEEPTVIMEGGEPPSEKKPKNAKIPPVPKVKKVVPTLQENVSGG